MDSSVACWPLFESGRTLLPFQLDLSIVQDEITTPPRIAQPPILFLASPAAKNRYSKSVTLGHYFIIVKQKNINFVQNYFRNVLQEREQR